VSGKYQKTREPENLKQVNTHVIELGKRYGLDLSLDNLPDLGNPETEAWLIPMKADIRELFTLILQEQSTNKKLTQDLFFSALLDMVAEYTDNFNNDEIRAIFQEAALEHHMKGRLITPTYIGERIGLIRKRRDEKKAIHLSVEQE